MKPAWEISPESGETGTIKKTWKNRIKIGIVYPNTYRVGMSNLGFQAVYRLFNSHEQIVCERFFVPPLKDRTGSRPLSVESKRTPSEFDIIAFSISYENDFPQVVSFLASSALPPFSADRSFKDPLVLGGGIATFLNPEPIAPFFDLMTVGEAEAILPGLMEKLPEGRFESEREKEDFLLSAARNLPGIYVPRFYTPVYHDDGRLIKIEPTNDVPQRVKRAYLEDISEFSTSTTVLTGNTAFPQTALIEVSRGCTRGCRFCSAGFVYRPFRYRSWSGIKEDVKDWLGSTDRIGLMGAALSDLPGITDICNKIREISPGCRISFSSLRADSITESLVDLLRSSGTKTATLAPDAGSQRMRDVINKGLGEPEILDAVERLVRGGIMNLRLYFMVGLPFETDDDVREIIAFVKRIKHRFLAASRHQGKMGRISLSINSFVPKAFTPFQWVGMDTVSALKGKIKRVKNALLKVPNVEVHSDLPKWSYLQNLLARGDRRLAGLLVRLEKKRGNWPATLKESPLNPDFFVLRERDQHEPFPWEIIDHGIKRTHLFSEYRKASAGITTPQCPITNCNRCGLCKKDG